MRKKIIDLVLSYPGNYRKVLEKIRKQEWAPSQCHNFKCTVIGDKDYPECYYRLQYPPLVLFYEGHLDLLDTKTLSVVGSREYDEYSYRMTRKLVTCINEKVVIVSGLARGIDTVAHQSAKQTIGILGCGLDVPYPKSNTQLIHHMKKEQLVLSEYPPGTKPLKHHFPWRNRLIVASSKVLWVMSAKFKSGTMHSVNEAISLNNDIYCLPHPYDSEFGDGCHLSINQGAMVLTKETILEGVI